MLPIPTSRYEGPVSDHFDGNRFYNEIPIEPRSAFEVLRWQLTRDVPRWPPFKRKKYAPPPPPQVEDLRVTFINHATVLVQIDGYNLITDPIWSRRPSPFPFAGPARSFPPGVRFRDLPLIDGVLVSHNHYDHLDLRTLNRLAHRDQPEILLGLGNTALLDRQNIPGGHDLDWWQTTTVGDLKITFVPAQHWSARGLKDRFHTLWGGFVIEGAAGVVYFAGDTGFGPHFEEVVERFPEIRLALLPIGAYKPRWFMKDQHMSPAEALEAHRILKAANSLAIHFGTFPLADDGPFEAPRVLRSLLAEAEDVAPFWILAHGEGRDVPAYQYAATPAASE